MYIIAEKTSYKLSLFNKNPRAIVHLLNSPRFSLLMEDLFYEKYLLKAITNINGEEYKNIEDCKEFINECEYEFLNEENKSGSDVENERRKSDKEILLEKIKQYIDKNKEKFDFEYYKKTFFDFLNSFNFSARLII